MCLSFVTERLLLNFFCNLFKCKSFRQSWLTAQTAKQFAVIPEARPLFAATATLKTLPHAVRFLHLTANPQNQVNKMRPCKKEETKSRGVTALASLCLCLSAPMKSHWSMQTFCPYAQQTLQKQQRLLFLSDSTTTHISVKNGQKPWCCQPHRQRSNATSWQARKESRPATNMWHLKHPAVILMLLKMLESISHFHPWAVCEPDINPVLNSV